MASGSERSDRRLRPGEDTEVIPAVGDDVEDEATGEIPVHVDDDSDLDADFDSDLDADLKEEDA
ncbi:MAG: hypothetical protein ACRDU0_19265, partial [Mycobacterium sp.]